MLLNIILLLKNFSNINDNEKNLCKFETKADLSFLKATRSITSKAKQPETKKNAGCCLLNFRYGFRSFTT